MECKKAMLVIGNAMHRSAAEMSEITVSASWLPVHPISKVAAGTCLNQGKVVNMDSNQAELYQRRWAAIRSAQREESALEIHTRFSWKRTLELIEFAASLHGWPLPESEVSRHQNENLRRKWAVLNAKAKAQKTRR